MSVCLSVKIIYKKVTVDNLLVGAMLVGEKANFLQKSRTLVHNQDSFY